MKFIHYVIYLPLISSETNIFLLIDTLFI